LGKVDLLLCLAGELAPACADERYRCGVGNDSSQAFAQLRNVVYILDSDAIVAVRKLLGVRELANDLRGPDEAGAAKEHLQRDDGAVNADRKILLQTTYGKASTQEFRYPPMRKERDLQDVVCEAEFIYAGAEISLYGRPAMRERDQPNVESGQHQPMHRGENRERSLAFTELGVNSKIGPIRSEIAPYEIAELRIGRRFGPQRRDVELRSVGCEQALRHHEPPPLTTRSGDTPR